MDNKTSSIIEETKKIQIRRKPAGSSPHVPNSAVYTHTPSTPDLSLRQPESAAQETGLKASRDVRCRHMLISWANIHVILHLLCRKPEFSFTYIGKPSTLGGPCMCMSTSKSMFSSD